MKAPGPGDVDFQLYARAGRRELLEWSATWFLGRLWTEELSSRYGLPPQATLPPHPDVAWGALVN